MNNKHTLWMIIFTLFCVSDGWAQTFDEVADAIDAQYREALQDEAGSMADIELKRKTLNEKLERLNSELNRAADELAADQAVLDELSEQRDALKKNISTRLASKEELDAILKDHARNFLALAESSPYSAQAPERLKILQAYVSGDPMFGMNDVKTLLDLYFEDIAASRKKVLYTGEILDRSGAEKTADIVRIGHITALYRASGQTGYLTLSPASGRLLAGAEPSFWVRRNLKRYLNGETGDVYIDISGGAAIKQLARRESLADQLRSGGVLVIPILLVGLAALGLTIERLIFLSKVRHNTDALMTRVTDLVAKGDFEGALDITEPHRNRPTGRVLMAGLAHRDESREVIESALSEAILRETPRLERFLGALKVSAAVAPLLGLLGTVTGMINTFQVITTHGTGDPRLMAGGISEAMVTTQTGLAVAIPIMMVAAFLSRRANTLSQDMEEKGLALMGVLLKLKNNGNS